MTQTTKTLPLSENATGIREASTGSITVKGIKEKCINISFEVIPHFNKIIVKYDKVYLNDEDEILETVPTSKKVVARDEGEYGTIDLDENFEEVEGTYIKVKDEALNVTDWDAQLGAAIIPSLIDFVKLTEGYL